MSKRTMEPTHILMLVASYFCLKMLSVAGTLTTEAMNFRPEGRCSAWQFLRQTSSVGATTQLGPRTIQECLDYCNDNTQCVAVDIDVNDVPLGCWAHENVNNLNEKYDQKGTNQYILRQRCSNRTESSCYSPHWSVLANQSSAGAVRQDGPKSVQECLDYCGLKAPGCIAVEVDLKPWFPTCWLHKYSVEALQLTVQRQPGVNQYQLITRCVDNAPQAVSCGSHFKCATGNQCVQFTYRCNGIHDCNDGSDEVGCLCNILDQYQCGSGQCIDRNLMCTGRYECWDGTDERDCPRECAERFRCQSGTCVPYVYRCNGVNDCNDASDEHDCICATLNHHFQCANDVCIERFKVCDGIADCFDGSDERDCPCEIDHFHCRSGDCIPSIQQCNGLEDCSDGSDEHNCVCDTDEFRCAIKTSQCIPQCKVCDGQIDCVDLSDETISCDCPSEWFRCTNGQCIAPCKQCNGRDDCVDGSDEISCGQTGYVCSTTDFWCLSGERCVSPCSRCDGQYDCPDNTDEFNCNCTSGQFRCSNGQCVSLNARCDNVNDCQDTSDESGCPAIVSISICSPTARNLTGYSGVITSPYFPAAYVNNVNCQWRVIAPSDDGTVRLVFTSFNTQAYADYVALYDGYSSSAPLIELLSGRRSWSTHHVSSQRYMFIVFTSNNMGPLEAGFSATYFTSNAPACSASSYPLSLTNSEGVITSPFYPIYYPNNADCRWRVGSANVNGIVRITFTTFATNTLRDIVSLYDGFDSSAPLIASLSGFVYSASSFSSTQRYMYITFTSNFSTSSNGFSAYYMVLTIPPACIASSRPMNMSSSTGFITSPLYPNQYPDNADCQWLLISPDPHGVMFLMIAGLFTEPLYDTVYIYDGRSSSSTLLGTLSGNNYLNRYISSQRYMFVRFTSNLNNAYIGFNATFASRILPAACFASNRPQKLMLRSGTLNVLAYFPNNVDCRWLITARSNGEVVQLIVNALSINFGHFVNVYDGSSDSLSTRLVSLSAYYDHAFSLITSRTHMLVTLSTGISASDIGFNASYSSVSPPAIPAACSASSRPLTLAGNSGLLTSPFYPLYYGNDADCQWLLVSPSADKVIRLYFHTFQTSSNDTVYVHDGSSTTTPLLETLSGGYSSYSYTSTQRNMFIRFTSSASDVNIGFNATYTVVANSPACAESTRPLHLTNNMGTLTSPNYPSSYTPNDNCQWIITSPSTAGVVLIDFNYISLNYSDSIYVYDGNSIVSPRIVALSGSYSTPPRGYITSQRNMLVTFISSRYTFSYDGFNATYITTSSTNCPSLQFRCTLPRQCIASLKQCDETCDCGDCSDERNCTCDSQQLYCSASDRCIAICSKCDGSCDCSDCSDENNCPNIPGRCPLIAQNVSAQSGTLTSPNYPGFYQNTASCNWRIVAPSNDGIVILTISTLTTDFCCDFLSLHNGVNTLAPLLARLSGQYYSPLRYSTNQRYMYISFTSDSSGTDVGFSATFATTGTTNGTSFHFTCVSSRTIIRSCLRCNGLCECADCSDETNCNCTSRQMRCPSTDRCVPLSLQCDGRCQCPDCADERNCTCSSGNYLCSSTNQCLPASNHCDRTAQCLNMEDERNCSMCALGQWNCQNGWCLLTRNMCRRPLYWYSFNCTSSQFWCDGFRDCPDGSDEFNCTFTATRTTLSPISSTITAAVVTLIPRCSSAGQYQCANGMCVSTLSPCTAPWCRSYNFRCDGLVDCMDGSDERNCAGTRTTACRPGQFACRDNVTCLSRNMWCNGITQCPDGSDEINCPCRHSNQYQCTNGQCIYTYQRCNGYIDCTDGSDEEQCNCSSGQFRCNNGDCVTVLSHCQGSHFCTDYSDQINCSCGFNQFKCVTSFACISSCKVCDGTNDCSDGSDEADCSSSCNTPSAFRCTSGRCIEACRRCDGVSNCPDGSVERNCPCPNNQFRCVSDGSCISSCQVCDGGMQCSDGSDEIGCAPVVVEASSVMPGARLNFIYQGTVFKGGQLFGNNVTQRTADLRGRNVQGTSWIDADVALPSGNLTRFYLYLAAGDDTYRESGRMWLEIWRPYNVAQFQWQLIWHQKVNSLTQLDSLYMFSVNGFAVNSGDRMGVRFEGNAGLIPFDLNDNKRVQLSRSQNQAPNVGQTVVFGRTFLSVELSLAVLVETVTQSTRTSVVGSTSPSFSNRTTLRVPPTTTTEPPYWWSTTTYPRVCSDSQFACAERCLPSSLRCNGFCSCGDCSDEHNCVCTANQFQCTSTRSCINLSYYCDSTCQCADCSDEINCACEPRGLKCGNGRCYLSTERCDGVNNCGDYSDELNCTICSSNQVRCAIGLCINSASWCDGFIDCPDGSDERPDCRPACSGGSFTCDNGRCVLYIQTCDGVNDCGDFSDEIICACSTYSSYRCQMGLCLSISTWCDGYRDCPDNSDELPGCNESCPGSSRRCPVLRTCIQPWQLCNAVQDCPDGSDEVNCRT